MKAYGSVNLGGQAYKTVVIGTQTWMAENSNYNPGTGTSVCYNNQASNCDTYGRLYNWQTAQMVCPSGWHLPNNADWSTLTAYVGSNSANKLKATSGWNNSKGVSNGTDEYSFSALPGGHGSNSNSFDGVGYQGCWWSASEDNDDPMYPVYYMYITVNAYDADDNLNVNRNNIGKSRLLSVRCVKD
jgi:uncharacterized protein (TIGR02145 family)